MATEKTKLKVLEILNRAGCKMDRFTIEQVSNLNKTNTLEVLNELRKDGKVKRKTKRVYENGVGKPQVLYWGCDHER